MFFDGDRIDAMREMILADDEGSAARRRWRSCCRSRRKDFVGIFEAMDGLPVTIRLLDPPLHEFLPHDDKGQAELAKELGIAAGRRSRQRVEQLHEINPMLGHRGCRLAITYPEILRHAGAGDHRGRDRRARRRARRCCPRS